MKFAAAADDGGVVVRTAGDSGVEQSWAPAVLGGGVEQCTTACCCS